jgi:tRNA-dihydrouridine synthase
LGWSKETINARVTGSLLEGVGIAALAVHGRTKEQGYSGAADWEAIAEVAETISIPTIGNGDLQVVDDIVRRLRTTKVRGLMVGRAAMTSPWLFARAKRFIDHGQLLPEPSIEDRWSHILRHCTIAVAESSSEKHTITAMRARLMAYSKGMPAGRLLRAELQQAASLRDVQGIAARHLDSLNGITCRTDHSEFAPLG